MNVVATGQWGKPKSDAKHDFCGLARGIGTVVDFGKDDFVFREGDSPRYKYVVGSGAVEVSSRGKVIETMNEGETLGMLALIDDQPRITTARTIEPCELALLDKKKSRFMVEETPNFVCS